MVKFLKGCLPHWLSSKSFIGFVQNVTKQQLEPSNSSHSDNILSAVTSTISTAIQSLEDTLKMTIQDLVSATVLKSQTYPQSPEGDMDTEGTGAEASLSYLLFLTWFLHQILI